MRTPAKSKVKQIASIHSQPPIMATKNTKDGFMLNIGSSGNVQDDEFEKY